MPDPESDPVREVTEAIADGKAVDWNRLEESGAFPPREIRALRTIDLLRRLHAGGEPGGEATPDPPPPVETGFDVLEEIGNRRQTSGAQTVVRSRWHPLPARLWEALVREAGIPDGERWCTLGRDEGRRLARLLTDTVLPVSGKSMNKEEFVTCGGISLPEVNFKTMESRIVPGLFFAGEALDIDGVTGGFNFQAAWTTGWIAGRAMAGVTEDR